MLRQCEAGAAAAAATGAAACAACRSRHRRCKPDCVFAPFFGSGSQAEEESFDAIHKVFGASNASKLLSQLPVAHRALAVSTMIYEAQARQRNPVYGCVAEILDLQKKVANLQEQLTQAEAQLACGVLQGAAHSPAAAASHYQADSMMSGLQRILRQADDSARPAGAGPHECLPLMAGGFRDVDDHDDVARAAAQLHCAGMQADDELHTLAQAMVRR